MRSAALTIGVIGAGAWGTALAKIASRAGHRVSLWSRSAETATRLNREHRHPRLPAVTLGDSIVATARMRDLENCGLVIMAVPAQVLRTTAAAFAHLLKSGVPVIVAAKGIEIGTGKFMTEVLRDECAEIEPYILSGPSFAADVVRNKPTAVTLAGHKLDRTSALAGQLSIPTFRIYSSSDLLGVQLGGSVKNVLAIACGVSEGKGLGDSARAALTTRAFSEMLRFGRALGADPATLTGLSGLGDLLLTCSSRQSRNFSLGIALGRNEPVQSLLSKSGTTVEGVATAKAVTSIAADRGIDLPVCGAVNAILEGRLSIDAAIEGLMSRPLRVEE
jgi:glycerol-3-phosphate dehydrogenase (NAD(P)+)